MRKTFLLAAAMFAGTVLAPTAQATVNVTNWDWNPAVIKVGGLFHGATQLGGGIGAGRFELTGTENGNPIDFFSYCVDIFEPMHNGVFTRSPISLVLPNAVKQAQLLALLEHSDTELSNEPDVTNQRVIAAATQLAVWEIVYEPGAYDTHNGTVYTIHGTNPLAGDARTLANSYLTKLTNLTWVASATKKLVLLYAPKNQSQVMLGAVPEPGTWAMMFAGVGMIGGMLRRKRRIEAQAAV
jgi:hypothetical protein